MWSAVETVRADPGAAPARGKDAAPCARGKHAAVLLGQHVYVLGGRGAGGAVPLRDFWRYSLVDGVWERLECAGDAPPALQEHSATAHGTKIYVFGGEPGSSNDTPLWIYDTTTGTWRKHSGPAAPAPRRRREPAASPAPRGRRGHSAHALKDCLLIYGGYKDLRGSTNELWAFHYESEWWQAVRTVGPGPARHRHAAALHAARLYVHAGACDLRAQADLWHYDTLSRVWTQVRTPARVSPAARSGHAGLRAGAHLYIFGGEVGGQLANDLWRFHFTTETWERIEPSLQWPSPRVDARALLVAGAPPRTRAAPPPRRPDPPHSLLKEISKISSFHIRRAARCSYSVLAPAPDRDSTESLVRDSMSKSHSTYVMPRRDGDQSPREGDLPDAQLAREPISVPDFADMVLPTPVLSPIEATKLVYLDSDDEEDIRREIEAKNRKAIPKSASVRFTQDSVTITTEEEGEMSTSDYASAERVNRLSGTSLGFSNPHYLGPDVRRLGIALTPDSGVGPGDIELQDLSQSARTQLRDDSQQQLHLVLVGGKEPPHHARLQAPLSMWTYRLL